VVVKVDDNTKIEFSRSAIATVSEVSKVEKIEDKAEASGDTEESKS
jgi:preprotein translocase subunit YajC